MSTSSYLREWCPILFDAILNHGGIDGWNAMREVDHQYERGEITGPDAAKVYVELARKAFWAIDVEVPMRVRELV